MPRNGDFEWGTPDGYEFYLKLGALANADERHFRHENPYWTDMVRHTSFDDFWKGRNLESHLKDLKPAVLVVGGWYDAEDLQGPLRLYRAASSGGAGRGITLVMGPWAHGGWGHGKGDSLGRIQFGAPTAEFFRERIERPFFEHHLRDAADPRLPAAWMFETGTDVWKKFDAWPPAATRRKMLYFRKNGELSFEPPAESEGFDEYTSDPMKPVPFTSFIAQGMPVSYMVDDQRFASRRTDVLTYQTAPLESEVTIGGPVSPRLFVSTTGTDSDFVVKLIDVYPGDAPELGGYERLLRGEPFRARFHKGFDRPEALTGGKIFELKFDMPDLLHTFRRGHRIMVQVQSTWFPLVDRNPQTYVDIPNAKAADFRAATQRVERTKARASGVDVLILE